MAAVITNGILSLSPNALERICLFVNCKSLLHLSEVSKLAKEIADNSIRKRMKGMTIYAICIFDDGLAFNFQSPIDVLVWESHILSGPTIPPYIRKRSSILFNMWHIFLGACEGIMNIFLDYLKPLIRRCQYETVNFGHVKPEIIHQCAYIFENIAINQVEIRHDRGENTIESSSLHLLAESDFIQKCKPNEVYYVGKLVNKDFIKFVRQVSSVAKKISVFVEEKYDTLPFARQVLGSKCKLMLEGLGFSSISQLDAEKLIQDFAHSEEILSFSAKIVSPPMDTCIGSFKVKVSQFPNNICEIKIEHLDMI